MTDTPLASIVMPVRNGGSVCLESLSTVLQQKLDGGFEVIVIDSESSDGSSEAIERLFADPASNPSGIVLRLVRIAARDFGHGKTRNQSARLAAGESIVFLSQDATPMGTGWLANMLGPLRQPEVVGVFCRQVARNWASLPERFILETVYPGQSAYRTRASLKRRNAGFILFSNAASVIRRSTLLRYPFAEHLMMCEDAHWAVSVLSAGHTIAYTATARVLHSHGYSLKAAMARTFDCTLSFEGLPGGMTLGGYGKYLGRAVRFTIKYGEAGDLGKLIPFELARCLGFALGSRYRWLPVRLCRLVSGYPHWFDRAERSSAGMVVTRGPTSRSPCRDSRRTDALGYLNDIAR